MGNPVSGSEKVIVNKAGHYVQLYTEKEATGVKGTNFVTRVAEEYNKNAQLVKKSVWSQPSGKIQSTFVPDKPGSKDGYKYIYDSTGKNPTKSYMLGENFGKLFDFQRP